MRIRFREAFAATAEEAEQLLDPTAGRSAGTVWNAEMDPTRGSSAGSEWNLELDPTRPQPPRRRRRDDRGGRGPLHGLLP